MPGLPPLIEEDVQMLDAALDDLLRKSEAAAALVIDKGGPLISQRGAVDRFRHHHHFRAGGRLVLRDASDRRAAWAKAISPPSTSRANSDSLLLLQHR